jgi:hypothetical protein
MRYVYTVWMRDLSVLPDDPDYEWPACFIVDGATEQTAKQWADRLAATYATTHNQCVIGSTIEALATSTLPGADTLPAVEEGEDAPDEKIGW